MQTAFLDESGPVLDLIANKVKTSKRIVVVSGAGLSCSAGIPDFRGKNGLYNFFKKRHSNRVVKGQDLFDAGVFRTAETTQLFFTVMAELRAAMAKAKPTPGHHFLRHLSERKKLLRVYTQNIDGFESRVGIKDKTVMLHGDVHRLRCTHCRHEQDWTLKDKRTFKKGGAPECKECVEMEAARQAAGRRTRSVGVLRPQVVLYNEEHPQATEIGLNATKDTRKRPDLLLVMGTSLRVDGIKGLVRDLSKAVKEQGGICVLINDSSVPSTPWDNVFDYHVKSTTDGWFADLRTRVPGLWLTLSRINFEPELNGRGTPKGAPQGGPKRKTPEDKENQPPAKRARNFKPVLKIQAAPKVDPQPKAEPELKGAPEVEPQPEPIAATHKAQNTITSYCGKLLKYLSIY